jgi:hypothetical protein
MIGIDLRLMVSKGIRIDRLGLRREKVLKSGVTLFEIHFWFKLRS